MGPRGHGYVCTSAPLHSASLHLHTNALLHLWTCSGPSLHFCTLHFCTLHLLCTNTVPPHLCTTSASVLHLLVCTCTISIYRTSSAPTMITGGSITLHTAVLSWLHGIPCNIGYNYGGCTVHLHLCGMCLQKVLLSSLQDTQGSGSTCWLLEGDVSSTCLTHQHHPHPQQHHDMHESNLKDTNIKIQFIFCKTWRNYITSTTMIGKGLSITYAQRSLVCWAWRSWYSRRLMDWLK